MRTDSLIDLLARNAGAAPRAVVARRLVPSCVAGLAVSVLLALVLIGPLPLSTFETPAPWIKLGFTGALAITAAWLAARAAKPAASIELPRRAWLGVVVAMAVGAAVASTLFVAPGERMDAFLGETWQVCPWNVLALSLPALVLSFWALRGLAPTRPRLAGMSAGLLAGALGAFGYSFACPESSPAFVAVWYTLGVVLTGMLGAALGARLLRW